MVRPHYKMRKKAKDYIGKKINKLTIIDVLRENKRTYFVTKCECGNRKTIRADSVLNGKIVSCGCYNKEHNYLKPLDLTGEKFGRLKVMKKTNQRGKNGSIIWECLCECGNKVYAGEDVLKKGSVRSCGCFATEQRMAKMKELAESQKETNYIEGTSLFSLNAKIPSTNTSGHKGVTWDKNRNLWAAQIVFKGKNYHLGRYANKEEAIKARENAEEKIFKKFLEEHK